MKIPTSNYYDNNGEKANAVWQEIMRSAKVGDQVKVKLDVVAKKPKKSVNLKTIRSADDLDNIQKRDIFLYYSIPAARSAKLLLEDATTIDTSNLGVSRLNRRNSCPSRCPSSLHHGDESQKTVVRRTVLSTEVHPDLLLVEDMGDDVESIDL